MLWAWIVSLPVTFVNSVPGQEQPAIGVADALGWAASVLGFAFQVVADLQKYNFRADPANRGKFCAIGVWRISRHPNYFGEMAMWWGIWVSACPVVTGTGRPGAGWPTLLCPLWTMFILLFLSGLPTAEGASLARYYEDAAEGERWEEYRRRTSPVVPMPPALYAQLPAVVKRCLFCEFRFLEYRPTDKIVQVQEGPAAHEAAGALGPGRGC